MIGVVRRTSRFESRRKPASRFRKLFLAGPGRLGEVDLSFADGVVKLLPFPLKLAQEIYFRLPEFGEDRIKLINHGDDRPKRPIRCPLRQRLKGRCVLYSSLFTGKCAEVEILPIFQ
jgi:hypothetical protein